MQCAWAGDVECTLCRSRKTGFSNYCVKVKYYIRRTYEIFCGKRYAIDGASEGTCISQVYSS